MTFLFTPINKNSSNYHSKSALIFTAVYHVFTHSLISEKLNNFITDSKFKGTIAIVLTQLYKSFTLNSNYVLYVFEF